MTKVVDADLLNGDVPQVPCGAATQKVGETTVTGPAGRQVLADAGFAAP
ncbi:hypothetical protein ACFWCF_01510 [Rhodococcus sp. NPDC060090]